MIQRRVLCNSNVVVLFRPGESMIIWPNLVVVILLYRYRWILDPSPGFVRFLLRLGRRFLTWPFLTITTAFSVTAKELVATVTAKHSLAHTQLVIIGAET